MYGCGGLPKELKLEQRAENEHRIHYQDAAGVKVRMGMKKITCSSDRRYFGASE